MKKVVKYALVALAVGALGLLPLGTVSRYASKNDTITLSKGNLIVLSDVIDGQTAAAVMDQAKQIDGEDGYLNMVKGSKGPIYIFMYTPGGSVQAGLELIEGLHGLHRPVNTLTSFAASMGFQMVQGLGERLILKSGVLMSHHATGGAEGQLGGKGTSQLQSRLGLWERRLKEMDEQTVRRTKGKQTLESYQASYDHELWVTGTEAVDQGYADKVVTVRCDDSLNGFTTHQIQFMGIPIDFDLSDCPLNQTPVNIRVHLLTNKGDMILGDFLSKDGSFGPSCLQYAVLDSAKVCAIDTSLTLEKVNSFKGKFLDRFNNPKDYVVPMQFK